MQQALFYAVDCFESGAFGPDPSLLGCKEQSLQRILGCRGLCFSMLNDVRNSLYSELYTADCVLLARGGRKAPLNEGTIFAALDHKQGLQLIIREACIGQIEICLLCLLNVSNTEVIQKRTHSPLHGQCLLNHNLVAPV